MIQRYRFSIAPPGLLMIRESDIFRLATKSDLPAAELYVVEESGDLVAASPPIEQPSHDPAHDKKVTDVLDHIIGGKSTSSERKAIKGAIEAPGRGWHRPRNWRPCSCGARDRRPCRARPPTSKAACIQNRSHLWEQTGTASPSRWPM
jgi:hypothetical protein